MRRPFTDSEEFIVAKRYRPEDRRLSAVIVAAVGVTLSGLLVYLAIGAC